MLNGRAYSEDRIDVTSTDSIWNAMYFGHDCFLGEMDASTTDYFIIFPHLDHDIRQDFLLMQLWQDRVFKPAFDQAWKSRADEGKGYPRVPIDSFRECVGKHNSWYGGPEREPQPGYDLPDHAEDLLHFQWPDHMTDDPKESSRAQLLENAWSAREATIAGDPDLVKFKDMLLVAVTREQFKSQDTREEAVARAMDSELDPAYIDAEYFHVVFEEICLLKRVGKVTRSKPKNMTLTRLKATH